MLQEAVRASWHEISKDIIGHGPFRGLIGVCCDDESLEIFKSAKNLAACKGRPAHGHFNLILIFLFLILQFNLFNIN